MPEDREYVYSSLQNDDIRLITLLPDAFDNPITVEIYHVRLRAPQPKQSNRLNISQLKATLPSAWRAYETLEGKFLFVSEANWEYTWDHPSAAVDRSSYDLPDEHEDDSHPTYEALSYAWGPFEDSKRIFIKSKSQPQSILPNTLTHTTLSIRKNLHEALRYLRGTDKPRTLWIDAISLNQNDVVERGEQIPRMTDIYSLARRVVIWLGPASTTSQHALTVLADIGMKVEFSKDYALLGVPGSIDEGWLFGHTKLPYNDNTYRAIAKLIQRPWFFRLWVIQEAQLAHSRIIIQCGTDQLSWNLLCRAMHCLARKSIPAIREHIENIIYLMIPSNDLSFPKLAYRFSRQQCSDSRDKIYALLGLVQPEFRSKIRPHYPDSVGKVYQDSFLACMEQFRRLEFLTYSCNFPRFIDAPSWIPDLTAPRLVGSNRLHNQFSSGYSAAHAKFQQPCMLEVTGVYCCSIDFVTTACPSDPDETLKHVRKYAPEVRARLPPTADEAFIDLLARTLAADCLRERFPFAANPALADWKKDVRACILEEQEPSPAAKHFFGTWCTKNLAGRPFFVTREGSFGLGAWGMQDGDCIYVILGVESPIVLRPFEDRYIVIGECFVADLRDSCALLGPLPESWRVECRDYNDFGANRSCYVNLTNGTSTFEDPRLKPLVGWESTGAVPRGDNSRLSTTFKNLTTLETIDSDPRLHPDELKKHGVNMSKIVLV